MNLRNNLPGAGAFLISGAVVALAAIPARGEVVDVTIEGVVVFNSISSGPLDPVTGGDAVLVSFSVDSDVFIDGIPGDTRGYEIDQSSFSIAFDTPVSLGLLDPFPGGETPYFTLVDGFPTSDGFFVSTSPVSPGGVPLEQTPYNLNVDVGYVGSTFSSLDILDALGTYDFTGLTRFGFTLWSVFPDNTNMEIDFAQMTITPEPATFGLLAAFGVVGLRRRLR